MIAKYNCTSDETCIYSKGGIMKNKIGQLFVVGFPGREITPELKQIIR